MASLEDSNATNSNDEALVQVTASALPSGASTSANQTTEIASLSSIDTKLSSQATAANQATEITSLQLIDDVVATAGSAITAKGNAVAGTDGTNARILKTNTSGELAVNVQTSALPTGAATSANQSTEISSLSSIDTKLSSQATAANQSTEITSLQLIDDMIATAGSAITTKASAVAGTDGTNARIIKTNTSGEVATNVISSALPSGAATETTLAKLTQTQGSTTSGQSGPIVQGAVTTAAPTYTTAQTSPLSLTTSGEIRASVSGVATAANQTTEITALQILDDVPAAMNGAFSKGAPAMGQLDDTSTTAATEDNVAPVRITAQRAFHSNLRTAAGVEVAVTQGSTTSGQSGFLSQGAVTTSAPTYTTAQTSPLSLTTGGELRVTGTPNTRVTYSAFATFLPAGTGTTDVFTLTGSATKTVRVRQVVVAGTNTGNTNALVQLLRRSTANSGGTSTTPTVVPHDSASASGTAVVRAYTANPTTGTLVGVLTGRICFFPSLGSTNGENGEVFEFPSLVEPPVLRGTSEVFAVNSNSATLLGTTTLYCSITWTEE